MRTQDQDAILELAAESKFTLGEFLRFYREQSNWCPLPTAIRECRNLLEDATLLHPDEAVRRYSQRLISISSWGVQS